MHCDLLVLSSLTGLCLINNSISEKRNVNDYQSTMIEFKALVLTADLYWFINLSLVALQYL